MYGRLMGIFLIVILSLALVSGCKSRNRELELAIVKFADENYVEDGLEIRLSDFTSFEWDKVVVFKALVSEKEIGEAIGVEYGGSLDLMSGVIFAKDGKVVYEELIGEGSDRIPFRICPYKETVGNPKYRVFTPDEAVFDCRGVQYDKTSRNYILYPKD